MPAGRASRGSGGPSGSTEILAACTGLPLRPITVPEMVASGSREIVKSRPSLTSPARTAIGVASLTTGVPGKYVGAYPISRRRDRIRL